MLFRSGGFQVFSLAGLRKIKEEGVYFSNHINGGKIFMGPEESIRIQSNIASTIAMAFDECVANPAEHEYARQSCDRTYRWLVRCIDEMDRLNSLEETINREQMLFGINQGCTFKDIRIEHMKRIAQLKLDGFAIGGLAVGEPDYVMYDMIETVMPYMPYDKPRYLMGVGTPVNIIEAVKRGIDFFDCVLPSRNARHGNIFSWNGVLNLLNAKYEKDDRPIDENCGCPACKSYSRAYLRHLFKAREMLAMRLCVLHNLYFYNELMLNIRQAIDNNSFDSFCNENIERLGTRL